MNSETTPMVNWVPIDAAARKLKATPLNLLMHIKRGLLLGAEVDGAWLVEPASLEVLLQKRQTGAAPAVCQHGCGKKSDGCGSCR